MSIIATDTEKQTSDEPKKNNTKRRRKMEGNAGFDYNFDGARVGENGVPSGPRQPPSSIKLHRKTGKGEAYRGNLGHEQVSCFAEFVREVKSGHEGPIS